MDAFDLDVLGFVCDDFEAIHTIGLDLERDLSRTVPDDQIAAALLRLIELGFVDAFEFDPATNSHARVTASQRNAEQLWFLANALGRAEYERLAA